MGLYNCIVFLSVLILTSGGVADKLKSFSCLSVTQPTVWPRVYRCWTFTNGPQTLGWYWWQSPVRVRGRRLQRDRKTNTDPWVHYRLLTWPWVTDVGSASTYNNNCFICSELLQFTCEEGESSEDGQSLLLCLGVVWRHGEPEHHSQRAEHGQQAALKTQTQSKQGKDTKHSLITGLNICYFLSAICILIVVTSVLTFL